LINEKQLANLYNEVSICSKEDTINLVDEDLVSKLLFSFSKEFLSSEKILFTNEIDLDEKNIKNLENSLKLSEISIELANNFPNSKKILISEIYDQIFDFLKSIFNKIILPAYDSSGETDTKKKKNVEKYIDDFCYLFCQIINIIPKYVNNTTIKDEIIMAISDISLSSFFVEDLEQLQIYSLNSIVSVKINN
jgi:hypothetical protein